MIYYNHVCDYCRKKRKRCVSTYDGILCADCIRDKRKDLAWGLSELRVDVRNKGGRVN